MLFWRFDRRMRSDAFLTDGLDDVSLAGEREMIQQHEQREEEQCGDGDQDRHQRHIEGKGELHAQDLIDEVTQRQGEQQTVEGSLERIRQRFKGEHRTELALVHADGKQHGVFLCAQGIAAGEGVADIGEGHDADQQQEGIQQQAHEQQQRGGL